MDAFLPAAQLDKKTEPAGRQAELQVGDPFS
jgi:hypothetical protein